MFARTTHFFFNKRIFSIFVLLILLLSLTSFFYEIYSLLIGHTTGSNTVTAVTEAFNILPHAIYASVLIGIVGCIYFGIIVEMGGCLVFPFFSGIAITLVTYIISMVIAKSLWRFSSPITARRVLIAGYVFVAGCYAIVMIGHFAAVTSLSEIQRKSNATFEAAYGFSNYTPQNQFLTVHSSSEATTSIQELWKTNFDGSDHIVLHRISEAFGRHDTMTGMRFPSPGGKYYISERSSGLMTAGTVKDMRDQVVYKIPQQYRDFYSGAILWSSDEKYLAVDIGEASTTKYNSTDYTTYLFNISKKEQVASIKGVEYGNFTWGTNGQFYYNCGAHICVFTPGGNSRILDQIISCDAPLIEGDLLYCALSDSALSSATGKQIAITSSEKKDPFMGGYNYFVISQDINENSTGTSSIAILNKVPIYKPNILLKPDPNHLLGISTGIRSLFEIELSTGRIATPKNNIFTDSLININNASFPIIYEGK